MGRVPENQELTKNEHTLSSAERKRVSVLITIRIEKNVLHKIVGRSCRQVC